MVIRTEACAFSGHKIHPYRGTILVKNDSRVIHCSKKKILNLQLDRQKPVHYEWALSWRRKNKKTNTDKNKVKRRKIIAKKIPRGFQGLSLEEFNNKRKKIRTDREVGARDKQASEFKKRVEKAAKN